MRYKTIIADPPWAYRNKKTGRNMVSGAAAHYPTMPLHDIKQIQVADVAHKDAVLLLWVTWPQLPSGIELMGSWGFTYVTGFPWIKTKSVERTLFEGDQIRLNRMGLGFWVRGVSELICIGKKGSASPPDKNFIGLLSPNIRHSRKPEDLYQYAESLPGPYLELFARRKREGWAAWGNEVCNDVEI